MVTEYNSASTDTYSAPTRDERLELMEEALNALGFAVEAMRKVVEAERKSSHTEDASVATLRLLGSQALQLEQAISETELAIETPITQGVTEIEEPELEVVDIIVQPIQAIQPESKPVRSVVVPPKTQKKSDKREKYPIPTNNRLYTRILPAEELPSVAVDNEATSPIDIEIVSDSTIVFNNEEISLRGDELFVFNVFMLLRDQEAITASNIRERGFRIPASNVATVTLSNAISKLRERLQFETDSGTVELISRHGKNNWTTYSVNPTIITTGVVREGSTVTVEYPDKERAMFRIANRYKQADPNSSVRTLAHELPLAAEAIGTKLGSSFKFTSPDGDSEVKVVAIS